MRTYRIIVAAMLIMTLVLGSTSLSMAKAGLPHNADVKVEDVSAEAASMLKEGEHDKGEVLVVFKDRVSDPSIEKKLDANGLDQKSIATTADFGTVAVAEVPQSDSLEKAITKISQDQDVLYAQPNYKYKTNAEGPDPYNTNNPMDQWYLENIKARNAWKTMKDWSEDLKKTKVAVIDTGADIKHLDLQKNLNKNLSKQLDGEGGFVPLKKDIDDHGTHVSGIIGATYYNKLGISGVAAGSGNNAIDLMTFNAAQPGFFEAELYTIDIIDCIIQAEKQGAKVINMSFGGPGRDRVLEETLTEVYDKGVTLIAASGNENTDEEVNPSDVGEVISVCSTTKENNRASYSNYGAAKDISAPGSNIKSTIPGNKYESMSGTSMASPMVAAAAAMVLSVNPDLTPSQVKNILCSTADDSIGKGGFDSKTGYGLLNIDAAVKAAKAASKATPATKLSLKKDHIIMNKQDTSMIEFLVLPASSLAEINWSVNPGDEDVIEVDQNGKVTGLKPGSATVTATVSGQTATCKVSVNDRFPVEKVEIKNKSDFVKMETGQEGYPNVEVSPDQAEDKSIFWKSDDRTVAAVDEFGILTAKKEGTTTLHVFSVDGAEDTMTVTVGPSVKTVKITSKPSSNKLKIGSKFKMKADVLPLDALNKEVIWVSSNPYVAKVQSDGTVIAVKPGRATITARTKNYRSASTRITIFKTNYSGSVYGLKAKAASTSSIKVTWKSIPNADGYEVYRKVSGGSYKKAATVKGTSKSYTAKKLKQGKKYRFRIRAYYIKDGKKHLCGYSSHKTAVPKKVK